MSGAIHRAEVVGLPLDSETPERVIATTSAETLQQVAGWVLGEVTTIHGLTRRSVSFNQIAASKKVDRPFLGSFLAMLVDAGHLVWAGDGGYLPGGVS